MTRPARSPNDEAAIAWTKYTDSLEAEIEQLRGILIAALAKLDTMQVCCREKDCERASGKYAALRDSSCDLRELRGIVAAVTNSGKV